MVLLTIIFIFHHRDNGNCLRGSDIRRHGNDNRLLHNNCRLRLVRKILLRCFLPLLRCPADYTSRRGGRAVY